MLKRKSDADVSIKAADFADFNTKLFFSAEIPPDSFQPIQLAEQEYIEAEELAAVLQDKYKDATEEQKLIKEINTGVMVATGRDLKRWIADWLSDCLAELMDGRL